MSQTLLTGYALRQQMAQRAVRDWTPDPLAVPGWFHHRTRVLELVQQYRPQVCVELGTYMGSSAIPVAQIVRQWGGTVTCVDTWGPGLQQGPSREGDKRCPWMVGECAKHLVRWGVSASVRLIVAQTIDAAAAWSGEIDWLYVDADHSEEGCYGDLVAWWPHLKVGGMLVVDDYGCQRYPGVKLACDRFEAEQGQRFVREQTEAEFPLLWGQKR